MLVQLRAGDNGADTRQLLQSHDRYSPNNASARSLARRAALLDHFASDGVWDAAGGAADGVRVATARTLASGPKNGGLNI